MVACSSHGPPITANAAPMAPTASRWCRNFSDVTKPVAMPSYRHSAAAPSKPLGSGSNPPAASGLSASTQAAHGLGPFR
jgi:hypothetical protein